MKTIFKVGMKVYDQMFYPNQKGIIKKIHNNNPEIHFPIEVEFNGEIETYTLKGSCNYLDLITLSTSPYILQGFEQKASMPTIEEAVAWCRENYSDYRENLCGHYINEEYENAFDALNSLIILREYYNEGWQPDWKDSSIKYCIEIYLGEIDIRESCRLISKSFSFKSKEIAEKFLKEQKELLEIAKPLL